MANITRERLPDLLMRNLKKILNNHKGSIRYWETRRLEKYLTKNLRITRKLTVLHFELPNVAFMVHIEFVRLHAARLDKLCYQISKNSRKSASTCSRSYSFWTAEQ